LPSMIYQTPVFGLFYIFVLIAILFEAFEQWKLIAVLEVLVLAPFAFGGLPLAGWITILGMAIGALNFGSKKSVVISAVSVTLILLLSSILLVQNTAYMPINTQLYEPGKPELRFTKPAVDILDMMPKLLDSLGALLDFGNFGKIFDSLGLIADNLIRLLLGDSLILQLIGWGGALYLVGYLPAHMKPRGELKGALALLILLPVYFLVGMLYGSGFRLEFAGGIVLTIAVLAGLEQYGV